MITVLLVDDESIEREGLRLILNKNRSNAKTIVEASDGEQAIEQAMKFHPDIIFMDIKMPGMDGLTAVKEILTKLPNTKCIMVTAFDTFEYAQTVMKYGVREYLLKPSKTKKVLEAYDSMVAEINREKQAIVEKQELYQRLQRTASIVESEWIVSLMMDYVSDHNFDEWSDWLNLNAKAGFVAVFSFEISLDLEGKIDQTSLYRELKYVLNGQSNHIIVGPLIGFQVPVFITFETKESLEDKYKEAVVRSIIQQFNRLERRAKLVAGIGQTINDLDDFSQSYSEAVTALDVVFSNPGSAYMVYHDKLATINREQNRFKYEKDLFEAVKQADLQNGLRLFDAYLQLIVNEKNSNLDTLIKELEIFYNVLTRELNAFGVDIVYENQFKLLSSMDQVKELARSQFSTIIKHVSNWRVNEMSGMLSSAKSYLDRRFDDKMISLERVADQVGISSHYLSKLFKDHYGQSFVEYLTELRLSKAKGYLLDPDMPLKEIALLVGYKDPNYFSRVFKKELNISPTEWRSQNKLT